MSRGGRGIRSGEGHPDPTLGPQTVTLAIDAEGKLYWNDELLAETELPAWLEEAAGRTPQPELHLRADKNTIYQRVAEVLSAAQRAGITKLGFITEPRQP